MTKERHMIFEDMDGFDEAFETLKDIVASKADDGDDEEVERGYEAIALLENFVENALYDGA